MNKSPSYYCDKYVEKISHELEGCSENFKMGSALFPAFNHLNVYFPEAYQHMLKVWGVLNENN